MSDWIKTVDPQGRMLNPFFKELLLSQAHLNSAKPQLLALIIHGRQLLRSKPLWSRAMGLHPPGRTVPAVGVILLSLLPMNRILAQERDLALQPGQSPEVRVVRTKDVTVVTLAGVGPQDKGGKLAAPGDFAGQFKQTWDNVRRLIVGAGSPLRSIVSLTVYTTDAKWQDTFKQLQQERFSDWNPPTSFVVTQQLRTPGALLEIHAVSVIEHRGPVRR